MGCSIQAVIEVKVLDGYNWADSAECYMPRDLNAFALMANVLNSDDLLGALEPKGWPDDVSDRSRTLNLAYDVDAYSHSWLTIDELQAIVSFMDDDMLDPNSDLEACLAYMKAKNERGIETRLVFFFNN